MDPNAALARLRAALDNGGDWQDAAEDFRNLDEWLSRGGFPPDAWQVHTHIRREVADSAAKAITDAVNTAARRRAE